MNDRYILDGDRDELRNIRHELSSLRNNMVSTNEQENESFQQSKSQTQMKPQSQTRSQNNKYVESKSQIYYERSDSIDERKSSEHLNDVKMNDINRLKNEIQELIDTRMYANDDPIMQEMYLALREAEENVRLI